MTVVALPEAVGVDALLRVTVRPGRAEAAAAATDVEDVRRGQMQMQRQRWRCVLTCFSVQTS
jgi:hypothetical protein